MSDNQPDQQPSNTAPRPLGRAVSSRNYTSMEVRSMLETIKRIKPIGTEEWEMVAMEHAKHYNGRDRFSIMRKFSGYYRKKPGTGNPNVPWEVKLAKEAHALIQKKSCIGTATEFFDLEVGYNDANEVSRQGTVIPEAVVAPTATVVAPTATGTTEAALVVPPAEKPALVAGATPHKRAHKTSPPKVDSSMRMLTSDIMEIYKMSLLREEEQRVRLEKERREKEEREEKERWKRDERDRRERNRDKREMMQFMAMIHGSGASRAPKRRKRSTKAKGDTLINVLGSDSEGDSE